MLLHFARSPSSRLADRTGEPTRCSTLHSNQHSSSRIRAWDASISTVPPNPSTYAADVVSNGSFSNYHALQTEVRRRFSGGLDFQANYTFSKALTDFEGTSTNFEAYQDLTFGSILEKRRSRNDLTHVFKANAGYELPFGLGQRYLSGGALGRILGGFKLTGIATVASGRPVSIVSIRQTLNAGRAPTAIRGPRR